MTDRDRFAASYRSMESWLFDAALPLWSTRGVDPAGGFFEKIGQDGTPIDEPRRTRVIARQIYCFAAADRMGWLGDGRMLVEHGLAALLRVVPGPQGLVTATAQADGTPIDTRYDFYDHAFALFALAQAATLARYREQALASAHALQDAMEAVFRHSEGGFREDAAGTPPLRANPHMHMLEACLALAGVNEGSRRWDDIADGIVRLALRRFIDPDTGALRELFDVDWRALTDAEGQVIEPGHQFEWAWLLAAWNRRGDTTTMRAAERLVRIGCVHGVAASDMVVDELGSDLAVRSPRLRAWPQCERLKSHIECALISKRGEQADYWWKQADMALAGWVPFLHTPTRGLWYDRLDATGTPIDQPAPASTLYHLICALETAQQALKGRSAGEMLRLSHAAVRG